ncbi:GTP pyrophosphokinase family protein [Flavobacterium sp. N502540]|uniref:GTP pyrophosphokinase n=1 Tax=Flavobacterium sp. N502540 TaxID=2986838 RepID=UPI00222577B4|nr:(p)ppGpp synthetase [Flavobacterium sp. N502540]
MLILALLIGEMFNLSFIFNKYIVVMKDVILSDFSSEKSSFDLYRQKMESLLFDLLKQENVIIHHISSRTKDSESLSKKIDNRSNKYNSLKDITDLVGIRIISYLESDVDLIAEKISKEFLIDPENSIDKRELNTDQFGYKSLHLVVNLNSTRATLPEYRNYKDFKCEIQIRSILQHAWAEIEHDLGYKGKYAIPDQYKRSFNRLAALLETADLEFDRLKRDLSKYELAVVDLIKTSPQDVKIDQASLQQFNLENNILNEARSLMSKVTGWTYNKDLDTLHGITERFELFGMKTIKDIEDSLKDNNEVFFKYLSEFTKDFKYSEIGSTIVLFYYQHFLAGKTEDVLKITEYQNYGEISIAGKPERFIEIYQKVKLL